MFAVPPTVEARIFTSLPDALRRKGQATELMKMVSDRLDSFLEGPSFDRHGNLYCVDVPFGRIFRIDPQGGVEPFVEYDGEPNGLKLHRDGRLFIADRRHGLLVVDPAERRVQRLLERARMEPFRGLNDLVFAANGDLYFTDQGMSDLARPDGRVFRLRTDGRLELLLADLPGPNGIALDYRGRSLYVALTRSNSVLRATLLPDGCVVRVQNFIQLSGGGGPDGIAADRDGGLAVAHPGMGAVWRFDARGQPALRIDLNGGVLGTNLAYGGTDARTLYITEAETGTIQFVPMPVAGVSMFSHQDA